MDGLLDAGVDTLFLGECGTEKVYFAVFDQGLDGGIMVTASHNPKEYNGMKFVRKGARPISADTGLAAIHDLVLSGDFPDPVRRGREEVLNIRERYRDHLLSYVDIASLKPLRIGALRGRRRPGGEPGRDALVGRQADARGRPGAARAPARRGGRADRRVGAPERGGGRAPAPAVELAHALRRLAGAVDPRRRRAAAHYGSAPAHGRVRRLRLPRRGAAHAGPGGGRPGPRLTASTSSQGTNKSIFLKYIPSLQT